MAKMGKDIATAAKGGENARFVVPQEHEHVYVEAIVELESHNVWVRQQQTPNDKPKLHLSFFFCKTFTEEAWSP